MRVNKSINLCIEKNIRVITEGKDIADFITKF